LARVYEPDRYLAALLAPASKRSDLLALAAFSADLLRISVTVREPHLVQIRLQWWREALATPEGASRTGHPIADHLLANLDRRAISREVLLETIDAESDASVGKRPASLADLETWARRREGGLFLAGGEVLGIGDASHRALLAEAGQHYGVARLCATAEGRQLLFDLAPERASLEAYMQGCLHQWDDCARQLMVLPRASRPAWIPAVMVRPYFGLVQGHPGEDAQPSADGMQLKRVWRLWRAARLGRL
jgi:phytoene synthase